MLVRPSVGIAELAEAAGITPAALRYHCRDSRGMLYGVAFREGRSWRIPVSAAGTFRRDYRRWASLNKREPDTPPVSGSPLPSIPAKERTVHREE